MKKTVLDPCCGARMFYFDKQNEGVLFCDNRVETHKFPDRHPVKIEPDLVLDFRELPFKDESFYHVVFDPPHLVRAGESGLIYKKYGTLNKETWQEDLERGFKECWRVLKNHGTLVFKWSENQIKLKEVLKCFPVKPLYGSKTGNAHWLVFIKF